MSIKQRTRPKSAIMHRILETKGNVQKIMEACGITKAAVYSWYEPPSERAHEVARAIGWHLFDVRPDFRPSDEPHNQGIPNGEAN